MSRRLPRSFEARLAALVVLGFAARLIYALVVVRRDVLIGDAGEFEMLARNLAHGHGYVDPFVLRDGVARPTAFKPPGYPFALSVLDLAGLTGYQVHHVLNCLFGALTVTFTGLIGRRLAGPRAGLLAAGIAAVWPLLIAFDGSLRSESLYAMLVTGAVWAALRLVDEQSVARAVVCGAFIGAAALTRTEALLLAVFFAVPLLWRQRGLLRYAVVVVLAAVVVIAPWTIRNVTTFHRPVLVATNDGGVFRGANCDMAYHGPGIGFWFFECFGPQDRNGRPDGPNEVEVAAQQRREGLAYAGDHPGRAVVVAGVRVLRTWDLFQPRRQAALSHFLEGRPLRFEQVGIALYFAALVAAAFGIASLRRRRRVLAVAVAPLLLVTVSSAISYGFTRFRAGADPMVVVLAAVGLLAIADGVRQRRASTT